MGQGQGRHFVGECPKGLSAADAQKSKPFFACFFLSWLATAFVEEEGYFQLLVCCVGSSGRRKSLLCFFNCWKWGDKLGEGVEKTMEHDGDELCIIVFCDWNKEKFSVSKMGSQIVQFSLQSFFILYIAKVGKMKFFCFFLG
jgi:hypothetical protein